MLWHGLQWQSTLPGFAIESLPFRVKCQDGARAFTGFHRAKRFVDILQLAASTHHIVELESALTIEIEVQRDVQAKTVGPHARGLHLAFWPDGAERKFNHSPRCMFSLAWAWSRYCPSFPAPAIMPATRPPHGPSDLQARPPGLTPPAHTARDKHHRCPGDIICHGVWRSDRFPLSHRDVEELLFVRGMWEWKRARPENMVSSAALVYPSGLGEGETRMYTTILLAAALQDWERYSAHALAARELAETLATGASSPLHVLSVYEYPHLPSTDLPAEVAIRHREDLMRRTDDLMGQKMHEYLAPLKAHGLEIAPILRVGDPRDVIPEVATTLKADLLILGSHSKRGLLDIVLGGTAQQVSKAAPCTVVLVSPKKEAAADSTACQGREGSQGRALPAGEEHHDEAISQAAPSR